MKGKLVLYQKPSAGSEAKKPLSSEEELRRFERALLRVKEEQQALYEKAKETADPSAAEIFGAQLLILSDEEFLRLCREKLTKEKRSAREAVEESFSVLLSHSEMEQDRFFKERMEDLNDVKNALIRELGEAELRPDTVRYEGILMARKLSPRELLLMDKSRIRGLVLGEGSSLSHTVILARGMGIPLVLLPETEEEPWETWEGREALLIPEKNLLLFDADETDETEGTAGSAEKDPVSERRTRSRIPVYANISDERELPQVLQAEPAGIGLFRSEYLYLRHPAYRPTEEEQITVYRKLLRSLFPKPVVIRTADLTDDKLPEIRFLPQERKEMEKTQLRALLIASSAGNLKILFPRIYKVSQVKQARQLLSECKAELQEEGVRIGEIPIGVMIETPDAAHLSGELAEEVDFFSIGTNDLSALSMGCDRKSEATTGLPATVRSLVQMAIDAAKQHKIPVTLCGELATDLSLTQTFLSIGVDAFSVNVPSIRALRQELSVLSDKKAP